MADNLYAHIGLDYDFDLSSVRARTNRGFACIDLGPNFYIRVSHPEQVDALIRAACEARDLLRSTETEGVAA